MNFPKRIVIGSDHAGFDYKEAIKMYLKKNQIECVDVGTNSLDSCDYPDYAHAAAHEIENGAVEFGILICGSANGVAITANKHQKVRAALCWQNEIVSLARQHNDANIICLPARFVTIDEAEEMVRAFLTTDFEGGRHQRRVEKI
ncbi:MAG TPA: ribose 5-phosphate isomerase B [Chitinophagales bacterium]|jgi:ribose 5-phosphate isomerase B|nr:ribose 5-phosphate isomerase B [Chitinophagales bacterium]HQV77785.1 ribose 5-phosphate isomerase B [Chitinophagales bacterium]HQW78259.1 ribose 5-phosphate isomerase B [Chitinophagales bacterium]HRB19638.1 ribose 5-phosphate isomerase B [Chitinophagales bacterium]HRB67575.1 ribose 5-phosphate isomerase B [Chitinophagales bacterium]